MMVLTWPNPTGIRDLLPGLEATVKMPTMLLLLLVLGFFLAGASASNVRSAPAVVFQFGDSLSDTGNALIAFPSRFHHVAIPPYGMTYFNHPTGRNSDGRLIIDFLVTRMGLPLLKPYLQPGNADFSNGVNFATAGATALGFNFYERHHMTFFNATFPLDRQVKWFLNFQRNLQRKNETSALDFGKALYIIGEIGGNDYKTLRDNGLSYSEMQRFIPHVVQAVKRRIHTLYRAGARRFLVINIPPQGCSPRFLANGKQTELLDNLGCLASFDGISALHNAMLKTKVEQLSKKLRGASISYADFYAVFASVIEKPESYGIQNIHSTCCGIYTNSTDTSVPCGDSKLVGGALVEGKACTDPSKYIFWNDNHMTEYFYSIVANAFISLIT